MKKLIIILILSALISCTASKSVSNTPNSGTGGNNKPVTANQ